MLYYTQYSLFHKANSNARICEKAMQNSVVVSFLTRKYLMSSIMKLPASGAIWLINSLTNPASESGNSEERNICFLYELTIAQI